MPLLQSETLQSYQIDIIFGFDGSESKAIIGWSRQYKPSFPCRVAFAINQHYPELQSGFYRNKRLVALVQEALLDVRLHIVIEDNFQEDRAVPEELLGSLEQADDYLLVDASMRVQGRLNVWESLGGQSKFYHDRFITEVVTDEKGGEELVRIVIEKCRARRVARTLTKT